MCNNPYCFHNIDKTIATHTPSILPDIPDMPDISFTPFEISVLKKMLTDTDKKQEQCAVDKADLKWDKGKAKYSLILSDFLNEMAVILTKGEINHPKINGIPSWQHVEPARYIDAMYRHICKYRNDPGSLDSEMGTDHMAHVAVNAMFLWWFGKQEKTPVESHSYEETSVESHFYEEKDGYSCRHSYKEKNED